MRKRTEILAVEPDFLVLVALQVQNLRPQQFKGAQQFAAALEQQSRIGPGEFHENFRMLPLAILRDRRIDRDPVFQFESAIGDDGLQKFANLFGGSNFVGNWHR